MKLYLYLVSFIFSHHIGKCVQPYFPSQIVFSPNNGEISQRVYQKSTSNPSSTHDIHVMKYFPYTTPDSPQSKHWQFNASVFKVVNYIKFNYNMLYSNRSSTKDEDYWYVNEYFIKF